MSLFPGFGQLKRLGRVRTAAAVTAFPHHERPAAFGSQAVGTETKCMSSTLPERLLTLPCPEFDFAFYKQEVVYFLHLLAVSLLDLCILSRFLAEIVTSMILKILKVQSVYV